MNFRSLKTGMAINIGILLVIAMLLIDLVMINTSRKRLIEAEIFRAQALSMMIEQYINILGAQEDVVFRADIASRLEQMIVNSGFSCAVITDKSGIPVHEACEGYDLQKELNDISRRVLKSGKQSTSFLETTWGVFWKSHKYIVISTPFPPKGSGAGCIHIVLDLEGFYNHLRHSQKIVFIYILTNAIILTFIGVFLLSRLVLKPVNRLVKRAEEYTDYTRPLFAREKENNEFGLLSKALNSMLARISEDKEALQKSLVSLEKANIELHSAQKELVRGEKLASIGRLSAGIAHEIGNPIGIVLGYLELLRQTDLADDEKNEYIQRTESEINRINTIVRQLLDFSRPLTGNPMPVSTHEIIEDMVEVVKLQPFMNKIKLELDLLAENDIVLAEPNQLRQVFLNLIINAADAISSSETADSGIIKIQTKMSSVPDKNSDSRVAGLNIIFTDNGHGIAEEDMDNVFDPFYTSKEPGQGTGLGLSVCFWIVESMGGKITAASKKNKGTTMTIHLTGYEGMNGTAGDSSG